MQNALPEGVPWGPVSGATLSLGWRLQTRGLAHSSLQAPPGVADCSSPRQSESAASTPTHCSVSPSESGAPLSSCTVRQPASRARWFSGCAIVWDLPPPAGCRAPGRVRGATGLLLQGSEVRARVASSAVELSSPPGSSWVSCQPLFPGSGYGAVCSTGGPPGAWRVGGASAEGLPPLPAWAVLWGARRKPVQFRL